MPAAPAASRAKNKKHTSVVTTGPPVSPSIPCAMVLTAYFALLCPPSSARMRSIVANLTPASGRQDHTTSPSAPAPLVLRHHPHPSHPAPTFVTTRTPLLSRRDSASRKFDLPDGESEIFFAAGLDRKKLRAAQVICPSGNQLEGRQDKTQNSRRHRVCWRVEVRNFSAGLTCGRSLTRHR